MDRKTIQCLSNALQHVRIYLQPFTSYSKILVGNRNFFLFPLHLTPPYGVDPGTIAVNVTRLERGFNACKTPRCIYPSIFNHLRAIARYLSEIATFSYPPCIILASRVYAPGTIAVNVTWIERGFNACQKPRSMLQSTFNRFPVIQAVRLKVRHFSTLLHIFASPGYAPGTIAVNVTWIERQFNAGQTRRCMYPSIFNRLRAIARYWSEIETFSYPPCI